MAGTRLDIQSAIDRYMNIPGWGFMLGFPSQPGKSSTAVTGVPTNGIKGFAPGALFLNYKGAAGTASYVNTGTVNSALWQEFESDALLGVAGVAAGYKIARGQMTTVTASDTVVTGLATVVSAVGNLESAPVLTCDRANANIGNQSGAPAAGSILITTWMPTSSSVTTPIAATTFSKLVNWVAVGTALLLAFFGP